MKKKTEDKKETQETKETNKKKEEDELDKRKELQKLLTPEIIKQLLDLLQLNIIDELLEAVKTGNLEPLKKLLYMKNYQEYNYGTFCNIVTVNSENNDSTVAEYFLNTEKNHSNYKSGKRDIPGKIKTPIINLENAESIDKKNMFIEDVKERITDKNIEPDSKVFLLRYSGVEKICTKLNNAIRESDVGERDDKKKIQAQFNKLENLLDKNAPMEKIKNQMAIFLVDAFILSVKNNHKIDENKDEKPVSEKLNKSVESEYLQELLEMWSQAKGIKIQDKEELEKNTTLKRQYHNYIRNFCTADSIRRGLSATKKEPIFDDLKREIYDCIIDVYDQEYRNNVERMLTVLHEASRAPLSQWLEKETNGWVGSGEKKGICHILAHEKYISWKGDEELNEFYNE